MGSLAAVAGGLFIYCLVLTIFGAYAARHDLSKRRVSRVLAEDKKPGLIDDDLSKSFYERIIDPFIKNLLLKFAKMMPKRGRESDSARERKYRLKKKLRRAGFIVSPEEYTMIRFFVILGSALLFGLLCLLLQMGMKSLIGVVFGAFVSFAVLHLNLSFKASGRREPMERQMPDVLDMLSLNVEAGLGFEQAMLQVIKQFDGPLIEELTVTYREITMGRSRREAMILFGERCDIEELKVFASSIVQAEKLGISIKNVLRTQAAAMRASRRNKVEEKAQKVQVKMLLPMIGFIFPVLLLVLLGPAIVSLINTL